MIPHSRPFFDRDDETALVGVLRKRFVTHGEQARKLGERAAQLVGKSWGVALQSGTDALTAAFRILGIGPGDFVALPSYLCSAPLDALALVGARPLLVDNDKQTLSVDPAASKVFGSARAVVVPHLFGIPAPVDRIAHPIVIEDCAQTLGVSIAGGPVGSFGKLTVGSFYGTKLAATGHGGFLAGDDPKLRASLHSLLTHDERESWEPHFHFLISDVAASLGLSQLAKLPRFIEKRRELAARYAEALGRGSILRDCVYLRFLVACESAERLIAEFRAAGIEAKRPVYKPLHLLCGYNPEEFPNAQWAHEHIVSVPLYPALSEEEVRHIVRFLREHAHEMRCWPPS